MRLTQWRALTGLTGAIACALSAGFQAQAAAPATPQGIVTANTYDGGQRQAIIDGASPSPDGTFYPGIAEIPFVGYTGVGSDGIYGGDPTVAPPGDVRNSYTMRLRFYFYAPKAGKLQLAVASDDPSNLFVATDANPANKAQVAFEPQWNPVRAFAGGDPTAPTRRTIVDDGKAPSPRPCNWSPYITVTKGQILFIDAVAQEGGGGDNLAVAYRYDGDADFSDGQVPITGELTSSFDRADVTKFAVVGVTGSPVAFTVSGVNGNNNGTKIDKSSIKAKLDGADVTVTTVDTAAGVSINYAHPGVFGPGSTHKVELSAKDTGGNALAFSGDFSVIKYALLGKDLKVADSAVNKNQPGFIWNVFQNAGNTENSNAKSDRTLAGQLLGGDGTPLPNLADPNAQGPASAAGKVLGSAPESIVQFLVPEVINFSQTEGENNGAFTPDLAMPGIPGLEGGNDGIVGEVLSFVEFPKGIITMGVNSDDGFKTTAGLNPADSTSALVLGEFSGGRGASDTIFQFVVEEAGIYQIRTTWQEGGGGANLEIFTLEAGKKVLLNDSANGGRKSYRTANVVTPAGIVSLTPGKGASGIDKRPAAISAVWKDPNGAVKQDSIKMKVAGKDVTATVTKSGDTVTATYKPTTDFDADQDVTVSIAYSNGGRDATASWSFTTAIDMSKPGTLFIETEDFDFEGGKTITDKAIGMTGKYDGGSFKDLGDGLNDEAGNKSFDVDYHEVGKGSDQAIYRPLTGVEAGKEDSAVTGGLSRGSFDVVKTFAVGWNDGGDWMNYTRTFPTPAKNYKVYGRLASGGAAINAQLDQVTEGVGTKTQKLKKLGRFAPGRATSGWDGPGAFETFPLTNDDGTRSIVNLGGKVTLRYSTIDGNNDNDFLIFQETSDSGGGGAKPTIAVARSGATTTITYTGVLQSADAVGAAWSDVAGATSPRVLTTSTGMKLYRTRQ